MAFQAPQVLHTDIESFHTTHFSSHAIALFDSQFLRPDAVQNNDVEEYYYEEEEEDDGLGYYPDGVKRTLTDEQIAIFRHSELEALRRVDRGISKQEATPHEEAAIESGSGEPVRTPMENGDSHTNPEAVDDAAEGSEDGEIETETERPALTKAETRRQKKLRARQRKRENQKFQPEKKPDLRKRTWDVVEAGMDGLYYDESGLSQNNKSASSAQRKQISYDD